MMALTSSAIGRLLTAAALLVAFSALALAAPKHDVKPAKPAAAVAPKKEAPRNKDEPVISAPHAILIDAENGGVLFERDPDQLIFPASLAKLMTAEYVFHELKEGRIKLTDEYTVSENAWRKGGAPSHGSTMFAAIHSKVSVDDLLHGMIVQSGNDACIVLAEGLAGNEADFADKITQRAREIGLAKSVFGNSNGLPDPNTKVTTREDAQLARCHLRVGIGQAIGITEHRFGEADLARALSHLIGEISFIAGNPFGQHDAGIVAGLDDHAVQQVVDGNLAVDRREHGGAVRGRAALAPGILADGVFVGELDAAFLDFVEHVFGGHQLGETGREDELVGVALEQHAAVFSVDQDRVRRADDRLVLVAGRFFFRRDRGGRLGRLDVMLGRGQGERAEGHEQSRRRQ